MNVNTHWICNQCEMTLCKKGRHGDEGACLDEHLSTTTLNDAYGPVRKCFKVPETSLKVRLATPQGNGGVTKRRRNRIISPIARSSKRASTSPHPPAVKQS